MQQVTPSSTSESQPAVVHVAEDVSAQQQIRALQSQLRQAQRMATIGELASTTTHEFNNLLMTVVNYAKLGMRHKDEASRDKAFQRINDAAHKATKVAGSVLSLARNRTSAHSPVSLKRVIENTVLLLEREFRKYRVGLETVVDDCPAVMGDPNELQRVALNLMVNARQATREGGEVRVSLQYDTTSDEVVLGIRDSGSGIPADVLPKIFEPFFTTKDGPDASGKGGTGVGLSSCKETIDAHRGRIRVESAVGKGTAFIIRLPATQETPPAV